MTLFNMLNIRTPREIQKLSLLLGCSPEELKYYNSENKILPRKQLEIISKQYNIPVNLLYLKHGEIPYDVSSSISKATSFNEISWESTSNSQECQLQCRSIFETKLGHLFEGDCICLLQSIPTSSIDLVFADPPFNLDKKYPSGINDNLKDDDYIFWCKKWLDECIRVLRFGGALLIWNIPKWHMALADYLCKRLTFRDWIAVDIKYSLPIQGRLYPSHYSLLYFVKGKKPNTFHPDRLSMQTCKFCYHELKDYGGYKDKMNPDGINLTDVWLDIPPVRHSKYKKRQTANELSIKLLDRVIQMTTNEGDSVLDPFGGSGTTYVVAELKNRTWIGTDIGDTQCIVSRFEHIEEERSYLSELRSQLNVLFTSEIEQKRIQNGIWVPSTLHSKNNSSIITEQLLLFKH